MEVDTYAGYVNNIEKRIVPYFRGQRILLRDCLLYTSERGIDRLHNENNPDVAIRMCFVDETGTLHELSLIHI